VFLKSQKRISAASACIFSLKSLATAPVFFVSICKPIQQNCIFQALETHPKENGGVRASCPKQAI
jgi:hypothetical protein